MRSKSFPACFALLLLAGCVARAPQTEQPVQSGRVCDVKLTRYQPPPAAKTPLEKVLPEGTSAGTALNLAGVQVVAINQPGAPADTQYLSLDEAIAKSLCTVRETGTVTRDAQGNEHVTDGDVNRLLVSNTGDKPIFLMAGDLVLGGKQDRILAAGLVVEPGTKDLGVQVFCVEHGRWTAHQGDGVSMSGKFDCFPVQGQADVTVKKAAVGSKDQSAVWQAVATNNSSLGVTALSGGGSFRATYDSEEMKKKLDGLMKEAAPLREGKPVGYAVMTDGDVAVLDLFDSTGLCAKLSEKLLRSYLITALSGGYTPNGEHPLTPRLKDKVTASFQQIKLSEAVAALDAAWEMKLEFIKGEYDPVIQYSANDQQMAAVIDSLGAFFNVWPMVTGPDTIALHAGVPLDDIQFRQTDNIQQAEARVRTINDVYPRGGMDLEEGPTYFGVPENARAQQARLPRLGDVPTMGGLFGGYPRNSGAATEQKPIEYDCKDTKRESTVHRGYMRR